MKTFVSAALVVFLWLSTGLVAAEVHRLSGKNSGRPPAFTVDGPWTLDWNARSDAVDLASFEVRLHDGRTGEFIGQVAEVKGTGNGLKLFEDGGTYQVVVVGTLIEWDIEIREVSEEQAARMKRATGGTTTLEDAVSEVIRLVPESSFESWRPQSNEQLLLFDEDRIAWRISFSPPCPGLDSATAISFVMPADRSGIGQYDSILIDDGTRCYFTQVVPGNVQR